MTNLKGGSGTTGGAVQGPHSRLIFRLARWSSNCLFGGPRTALQKAPFCRKKRFFYFLWSPNWLSGKVLSGPARNCPANIYIYIYVSLSPPLSISLHLYFSWRPSNKFQKRCCSFNHDRGHIISALSPLLRDTL